MLTNDEAIKLQRRLTFHSSCHNVMWSSSKYPSIRYNTLTATVVNNLRYDTIWYIYVRSKADKMASLVYRHRNKK